jgi:putative copper export protein
MDKNNIQKEDDIIRQMIKSTQHQASENLKYRIMHQIEAEKVFTPQKAKPKKETTNVLRDFSSIFGWMYAVLVIIIGGAYIVGGQELLLSTQFIGTVLLVSFVFSLFWLITQLDAYLRGKTNTTNQKH